MSDTFSENTYSEALRINKSSTGNVIKQSDVNLTGSTKIEFHDEYDDGVKIFIKKNGNDQLQEIKFVCSCGETKSIKLDYSE